MRTLHAPADQAPEWITTADGTEMYRVDHPERRPRTTASGDEASRWYSSDIVTARSTMHPAAAGIFSPRTWAEALYAVVDLAPAIAFFVLTVTLLSVGLGLTVIYVGIPILMLGLMMARLGGLVQIGLAQSLLGMPVPPPGPFVRRRRGFSGALIAVIADGTAWRAFGYFLIKIFLAPLTFGLAVGLYSFGLGAVTYPFWRGYLPSQLGPDGLRHRGAQWWPGFFVDTVPRMLFFAVMGALVLWVAPRIVRIPLTLDRMLIAGLLGRRD